MVRFCIVSCITAPHFGHFQYLSKLFPARPGARTSIGVSAISSSPTVRISNPRELGARPTHHKTLPTMSFTRSEIPWCRNLTRRTCCCSLHQLLYERARHVPGYPHVNMCEGACIQYWLCSMKSGHIGAFEELTDWNLLTPKKRLSHRGHPIFGIVPLFVLEFLYARTEPLVGVVVVVGYARTEDIQERKPFMLNALLDQFSQVFLFRAKA